MANYNKYDPELKEKVLRLYLEEGRTKKEPYRRIPSWTRHNHLLDTTAT